MSSARGKSQSSLINFPSTVHNSTFFGNLPQGKM
uniref:Uncharacterized protein n=1 Tax=Arundo donax TaxID=35708 RepID=A0A0A9EJG6_ARUDO